MESVILTIDHSNYNTVYRVSFALLHIQTISPCLNFPKICPIYFLKNIKKRKVYPVLNSSTDYVGERGENKTRANFFLYTVYHDSRNCSRDLILALREMVLRRAKLYLANEISQFVNNEFLDRIIRIAPKILSY